MLKIDVMKWLEKIRSELCESGYVVDKENVAYFHHTLLPDLTEVMERRMPEVFVQSIEPMYQARTVEENDAVELAEARLTPLFGVRCYSLEEMRLAMDTLAVHIAHVEAQAEAEERARRLNLPGTLESGETVELRDYVPECVSIEELRFLAEWVKHGCLLPPIDTSSYQSIVHGIFVPEEHAPTED